MLSRSIARHGRRSFSVGATPSQTGPGAFTTVGIPLALLGAAGGTYYYYANVDASLGGLLPASFARMPSPSSAASSSAAHAATLVPHAATSLPTTKSVSTKAKLKSAIAVDASAEKAERQAIALATTLSISEQAAATASLVVQPPHSNEKQQHHVVEETTVSTAAPMSASFVAAVPIVAASPIPNPVNKAVEIAHAEMRALLYKDISSVLKKDFSESAATEVSTLNESALRDKVVRLLEESHERARLEGIRLAEFLERSDNAWLKKFENFANSTREIAEMQVTEASRKLRDEIEKDFSLLLAREARRVAEDAAAAVETRVLTAKQEIDARASESSEAALARLTELNVRVAALDELLASRNAYEKIASRTVRFALSVAALAKAIDSRFCATQPEAAVRVAAGADDALVAKAVSMLPPAVYLRDGVPTFIELRSRFSMVSSAGRRSAAGGTGVLGQALSIAGATIVLPAQNAANAVKSGLVEGLEMAKDNASAVGAAAVNAAAPYPFLSPVINAASSAFSSASAAMSDVTRHAKDAITKTIEGAWGAISPPAEAPLLSGGAAELAAKANQTLAAGREVFEISSQDVRRTATVFDAAEAALAVGNLACAVEVLTALRGTPAEAAIVDWLNAAEQRITADRAVRLLTAKSNLMQAALYRN